MDYYEAFVVRGANNASTTWVSSCLQRLTDRRTIKPNICCQSSVYSSLDCDGVLRLRHPHRLQEVQSRLQCRMYLRAMNRNISYPYWHLLGNGSHVYATVCWQGGIIEDMKTLQLIVAALLLGLQHLHQQNMIHRVCVHDRQETTARVGRDI